MKAVRFHAQLCRLFVDDNFNDFCHSSRSSIQHCQHSTLSAYRAIMFVGSPWVRKNTYRWPHRATIDVAHVHCSLRSLVIHERPDSCAHRHHDPKFNNQPHQKALHSSLTQSQTLPRLLLPSESRLTFRHCRSYSARMCQSIGRMSLSYILDNPRDGLRQPAHSGRTAKRAS
jgi:hypothetical protein